MTTSEAAPPVPLRDPARGGGLRDVLRQRYLLKLFVRKELKVRYQGTALGMLWSYIQPLTRFVVYFVIIGIILNLNRKIPNFSVHIVAGMTMVHFFSETFGSTTKSVVKNKSLVRKVGLPREMFPVSAAIVSAVNLVPGMVVMFTVALFTGWYLTWTFFASVLLGFAVIATWGFGLGLLFSAFNVYYRDFSNVVRVITMLLPWTTPMIYAYHMVAERFAGHLWALEIYLSNPVTIAVQLFQKAFWIPTIQGENLPDPSILELAPHLYARGIGLVAIGLVFVWFAQKVFTRLEANFAEQL